MVDIVTLDGTTAAIAEPAIISLRNNLRGGGAGGDAGYETARRVWNAMSIADRP